MLDHTFTVPGQDKIPGVNYKRETSYDFCFFGEEESAYKN